MKYEIFILSSKGLNNPFNGSLPLNEKSAKIWIHIQLNLKPVLFNMRAEAGKLGRIQDTVKLGRIHQYPGDLDS